MSNLTNRIRANISARARLPMLLWLNSQKFANDRNYNLALVDKGFLNRKRENVDDTAILKRIVKAYNRAKSAQKEAASSYQVSNEWLPIYEHSLREVIHALQNEDIPQLSGIYRNFMRNACSTGLVGLPLDMEKCFFTGPISLANKRLFLHDSLHRYRLWQNLLGDSYTVRDLESPDLGNPYGYFIDDTFVKVGSDYLHYYATAIGRMVRSKSRPVVVELGGGYGGMAYYLVRDNLVRDSDLLYIDLDLPENLALTAYYLLNAFPSENILLFGEAEVNPQALHTRIALLPNFEITKLPDNSANLIFNSYSLAEMSAEAICTYISEFTRIAKEYVFHVNHNRVSAVVADDFAIDPDRFDLLYKLPALWNAERNSEMDEYEYLYRKISREGPEVSPQ